MTTSDQGAGHDEELARLREKRIQELQTQAQAPDTPVDLSAGDLDAFMAEHGTGLIDLWAPWCGPCKVLGPVLEELAEEMKGRIAIGKVNVDEHPEVSQRFQVQGIPTMILFRNGQPVDRLMGALPKPTLQQHLQELAPS